MWGRPCTAIADFYILYISGEGRDLRLKAVVLPLARPGLTTLIVFQFMYTWKAFLMPLVFVQLDELRPVALGMMFFFGRFTADRGMITAGVSIAMLPVILLYLGCNASSSAASPRGR